VTIGESTNLVEGVTGGWLGAEVCDDTSEAARVEICERTEEFEEELARDMMRSRCGVST
jgi:hypothetical protein